jgi:redox-sensitive bicupin YhaK (pirin superfamily)
MKKQISFSTQGQRSDIGDLTIYRLLPNRYADAVGPFVFLDHLVPVAAPDKAGREDGTGPHPHRGIATLTYILDGEGEHFDSRGHHGKIYSGGVQWMKAGNGIIHDETVNPDSKTGSPCMHAFQFWINLPAEVKKENPLYLSVKADEVPQMHLGESAGFLKVIIGEYEKLVSRIPNYSKQYLYHIHLNEGKQFRLPTEKGLEYAALVAKNDVVLNDTKFNAGDFIEFDREEGVIEIRSTSGPAADILVFGGERYMEPIVAQGPFVMNTMLEIAQAYEDLYSGKYGTIDYTTANTQART